MWVEGQGGIQSDQYLGFRYDRDGKETFNYSRYRSKDGKEETALSRFANSSAQQDFLRALLRWKRQVAQRIPNYMLPTSQGSQDTQGRDFPQEIISLGSAATQKCTAAGREPKGRRDSPHEAEGPPNSKPRNWHC